MNSASFSRGDLVYIPSEVILYQLSDDATCKKYHKMIKPRTLLLTNPSPKESLDNWCEVLYNGEQWYVSNKDVYQLIGENNGGEASRGV